MDDKKEKLTPTYLEYLEFTGRKEFQKFRDMSPVTREEIRNVDWGDLTRKLQEES